VILGKPRRNYDKKSQPEDTRSEQTAKRVLGGAGLGAVIGGTAGNAGMGAAIGAVAGTTADLVQKGQKVSVQSETLIEFRLQQPASLPARK
jgi:uncharacterized membrane protein